jgi:pyruvate/2-oxoglutarate dehydrogenase complex dihydrolipoamide dehydrogenase (E3) component
MKQYDLVVIGAGSAGLVAALTAHRRGLKVAMLEKSKIGGECTHSGCVPSKTLIHVARTLHESQNATSLGLPAMQTTTEFDFGRVMAYVDSVVQGVYEHEKPEVFQQAGIDTHVHPSGAQFLSKHEVRIGGEVLQASHIVVCSGSSPRMIERRGPRQPTILHNENFWQLREQPASLMFLGGGVISAELGQVMARFGSEVTIVDRNPRILKVLDEEVAEIAIAALRADGVRIVTRANCTACGVRSDGMHFVDVEREGESDTLETRGILFAAMGRVPNVTGMDLGKAGIQYDLQRGIVTNDHLQTTTDNIYACGDVTARQKFTHTASYQAEICIDNIMQGNPRVNDLSVLPWAIYMDPEIGHVGLSEAQARERVDQVQVYSVGCDSVDRFITEGRTEGLLKVVMDENDVILGADAIGAHAGEWIQLITVAMVNKVPITGLSDTIFAYPTFSEIVKKVLTRYLRTKM